MAKVIDPDKLSRKDLVDLVRRLQGRQRMMVHFMKSVGIWSDYFEWIKLTSSRKGG